MKHQAFNPYLPLNVYIPDGEPHVFGDRVYVFGSHDREDGVTFCSEPYEVWSAPVGDLSDWSTPGISYEVTQDPLYDPEKRNAMYAPDAVRGNDGKFYLYYCLAGWRGKGSHASPISVAVCSVPDGRYEYLGVVRNPDGTPFMKYANFDPALINDEGVIRLYSGAWFPMAEWDDKTWQEEHGAEKEAERYGKSAADMETLRRNGDSPCGPHHMVLSDDMLTLKSEPVRILPFRRFGTPFATTPDGHGHGFFEGSSIRRINGRYYFVYSSRNNHELCYATSNYPDRDFVYGGTIVSNGDIGIDGRKPEDRLNITGTTHGGIECINGQWYVFYHRLTHKSDYSRQGCAEPICFDDKGQIAQVEMTSCGLNGGPLAGQGTYPAVICCVLTNGRMPHSSNQKQELDIPFIGSENGVQMIRDITEGTLIGYRYFDLSHLKRIVLRLRGTGSGRIEVLDALEGTPLSVTEAALTGDWSDLELSVPDLSGIRPLYLRFHGTGRMDLLSLNLV